MRAWRAELLALLGGHVLELGAGTGGNLDFYPASVDSLTLVEPDKQMRFRLQHKLARHPLAQRCRVVAGPSELAPGGGRYDAVVATLVLCSVKELPPLLGRIRGAMRDGARLLSIEHIAAENGTARRRLQAWLEPIWKRVAGGCHLQRDPRTFLSMSGFTLESAREQDILGVPAFIRPGLISTWLAT